MTIKKISLNNTVPKSWQIFQFDEIFSAIPTKKYQIKNNEILEDGEYKVVDQGENIIAGFSNEKDKLFTNGPVIIFGDHTTSVKYIDFDFIVGADGTKILKHKLGNLYYLYSYLNYNKPISEGYKRHFSILSELNILFPPLPEQEAIAKILGKVDETIEKTQSMIEKLELRNKGLEQKLLKNDNRNEIKLQNLFERVTDKNSEGNTNVVTISAQKGFIKQNDFFNKFVASETLDNYYLVKKGEFCYNKSYSNGYPMGAIKRLNDFDKAVVTTLYICFRIKDSNKTSGDFFEYYFDAGLLDKGLTQIAYEGGRAHGLLNVSPNDFFNLKIRVPEFEEQKAIANILNKANEQLNKYEQKLEKLQELKKGLMQQLLTGKVRVKEFRN